MSTKFSDTQNKQVQFHTLLSQVALLYGQHLSTEVLALYWQCLQDYSLAQLEQAFHYHLKAPRVGVYMPKPADILRHLEGDHETRALEAWTKVDAAVRRIGPYPSVVFADERIHQVISALGGWISLCTQSTKVWPFIAQDFQKRYCTLLHKPSDVRIPKLRGIASQHLGGSGDKVVYVDGKQAKQSLAQEVWHDID